MIVSDSAVRTLEEKTLSWAAVLSNLINLSCLEHVFAAATVDAKAYNVSPATYFQCAKLSDKYDLIGTQECDGVM